MGRSCLDEDHRLVPPLAATLGTAPAAVVPSRVVIAARLDPPLRWLLATVTADSGDRPTSPLRLTAAAVDLPVRWLAVTVRSVADGTVRDLTQLLSGLAVRDTDGVESLPPLESGFYLYQDVVLGLFDFLGPRLPDTIAGPRTHRHRTTPARTGNTTRKEPT